MLVEDDKSLREIYGVRLLAEGYDIVSAADGEEALAMAIKERPKLIISDVMMPKISGFDMLDILRSTTETKDIKVIMMTALSSEDQRQRGEQLGADRYLVKSQVGIEDVIRVVHEVLGDQAGGGAPAPAAVAAPAAQPVAPAPAPAAQPMPAPRPITPAPPAPRPIAPMPAAAAPQPAPAPMPAPSAPVQPVPTPYTPPAPAAAPMPQPAPQPAAPSVKNRVIQPLSSTQTARVDINELLDRELAKEAGIDVDNRPQVASADQEKATVNNQLNQFSTAPPAPQPQVPPADPNVPTIQIDTNGQVITPGGQQTPPPSQPV